MFSRIINSFSLKLAKFALQRANFPVSDKIEITNLLFGKIVAFPIYDIIRHNEEGTLLVNGVPVDLEKAIQLSKSAKAAVDNPALELIFNQLRYEAMKIGVNNARVVEDQVFAKAVIYSGEQTKLLLKSLAGPGYDDGN